MCFSATASFISATGIGILGGIAHRRVKHPEERPLAWIPVLFACQQFVEGVIWMTFSGSIKVQFAVLFTQIFLFFAWVVWPILVPWASYKLETNRVKKRAFKYIFLFGLLLSILSLIQIAIAHPNVYREHGRLVYVLQHEFKYHWLQRGSQVLYIIVTLLPLLLSSIRGLILLGTANLIALLISFLFFKDSLPSVWCFFAAIISLIIVKIIPERSSL